MVRAIASSTKGPWFESGWVDTFALGVWSWVSFLMLSCVGAFDQHSQIQAWFLTFDKLYQQTRAATELSEGVLILFITFGDVSNAAHWFPLTLWKMLERFVTSFFGYKSTVSSRLNLTLVYLIIIKRNSATKKKNTPVRPANAKLPPIYKF